MNPSLIFFEPVDVWSFRDGRPFDVGSAFEAQSIFPPLPWTTLGAVRTAMLRRHCGDLERYAGRGGPTPCPVCGDGPCRAIEKVGRPSEPPPFRLGPPLPARRRNGSIEALFPTPADLVNVETPVPRRERERGHAGKAGKRLALLRPLIERPASVHYSIAPLAPVGLLEPGRFEPFAPRWISAQELEDVLASRVPQPPGRGTGSDDSDSRDFAARSPRFGIGMDNALDVVRRGLLYVRDVVELRDSWGLVVPSDLKLDLGGELARLGGDGRMARIHEQQGTLAAPERADVGKRFTVYLASPACFAHGWRPAFLDSERLEGVWPATDTHVRLVGAALAPAVSVGGWDLAKQQPRQMRKLVGAGSVFFFEVVGGSSEAVAGAVHGNTLTEDEQMARAGFGLAYVGRW